MYKTCNRKVAHNLSQLSVHLTDLSCDSTPTVNNRFSANVCRMTLHSACTNYLLITHLFIHSLITQFLSTYCIPGTVLDLGGKKVRKAGSHSLGERSLVGLPVHRLRGVHRTVWVGKAQSFYLEREAKQGQP